MHAEFLTTRDGGLLKAVREAISGADRVLICVAFAAESWVRLLQNRAAPSRQADRRARRDDGVRNDDSQTLEAYRSYSPPASAAPTE